MYCYDLGIVLVLIKDDIIYYFLFGEILLLYMDYWKIIGIDILYGWVCLRLVIFW